MRYRLNKEAFMFVLEGINWSNTIRRTAIPPILKLAATLELLAKGSYQDVLGNDFVLGMAQSTISKVFSEVLEVIEENICPDWIKFQISDETRQFFFEKYNFPGVIGCVDGTHIFLLRPSTDEHIFFNRKGKHSLNVMIVCIKPVSYINIVTLLFFFRYVTIK